MAEQVTFGVEVANALLREGVPVLNRYGETRVGQVAGNFGPYRLPEDTTLTSEQVTAAVQIDPGRLTAKQSGCIYLWNGPQWMIWDGPHWGWIDKHCSGPDLSAGPWELVYRPDLKAEPEEPPHPVQGTTLRAIMEWCARTNTAVKCRRPNADPLACSAGEIRISAWVSTYDLHEASDWQASTDDGKTWFVPGQVECSECGGFGGRSDPCSDQFYQCDRRDGSGSIGPTEESGPKETVSLDFMRDVELPRTTRALSEAVAHVESGGVMDGGGELFRIRDGAWEYRSAGESSWSRDDGKWFVSTGEKYTLHPADYLDDAPKVEPREGPELWAWMVRTLWPVDVGDGSCRRVRSDGRIESRELPDGPWHPHCSLPDVPCVPVDGHDWDDEGDHV